MKRMLHKPHIRRVNSLFGGWLWGAYLTPQSRRPFLIAPTLPRLFKALKGKE